MSDPTLRAKVIRLAHAKPELRPHLLPLLAQSKQASGDLLVLHSKYMAAGKSLLLAINKLRALYKKYDRMTGYKGKGTDADLQALLTEANGLRAAAWKLTRSLLNDTKLLPSSPAVAHGEAQAEKALMADKPLDTKHPSIVSLEFGALLKRVDVYYEFLADVAFILADLTGKKPLPANPHPKVF